MDGGTPLYSHHFMIIIGIEHKKFFKLENKFSEPFAADWTITKNGKRAFIYPPLAVEEGEINSPHEGQINFHRSYLKF